MSGYYASGIRNVEIDGERVDMDALVTAWRSRGDADKVRAGWAREVNILKGESAVAGRSVAYWKEANTRLIRERDAALTLVNTLRDTLRESTKVGAELIKERDAALDSLEHADREQKKHVDRLVEERDADRKRLWRVSRTDAAGKPGEYGDVIVWAADETDAVDVVMWGGYNDGPMYGYRDRGHTTVVPLSYGDDADDQVVVAQTLR